MNYSQTLLGAITLTFASTSYAGPISMNTANGTIDGIYAFDWLPGTSYTPGAGQATISDGQILSSYVQGSLGAFLGGQGQTLNNLGLNADYEITFVAGFKETVFGISDAINPITGKVTQSINFASIDDPLNYFEVWYDTNPNNDPLNGTGFNDGTLIASGNILPGGGGNISSTFEFSGNPNDPVSTNPNDYQLLDQFGNDNWSGTTTNLGIGGSVFDARTDFVLQSIMNIGGPNNILDIRFNASQKLAFNETNPGRQYVDENGDLQLTQPGTINGVNGDGVLLQVDGNSSFNITSTPVPNPSVLWLLSIGALGLLAFTRNK